LSQFGDLPTLSIEKVSGFSGSDVIVVDHKAAVILYSLNNKLVKEKIRSRDQDVLKVSNF
jgi:hypothetical protein